MDKNILNQEEVDFLLKGEGPKKDNSGIVPVKRFIVAFAQKLSKALSLRCSLELLENEELDFSGGQILAFALEENGFFCCDSDLGNALLEFALGAGEWSAEERGYELTELDMELLSTLFRFVPFCVAHSFGVPCSSLMPLPQRKGQSFPLHYSFLLRCGEIQGQIYLSLGKR